MPEPGAGPGTPGRSPAVGLAPPARTGAAGWPRPGRRPQVALLAVMALGLVILAGWLVRVDVFAALPADREPTKVATALGLLLLGGAAYVLLSPPDLVSRPAVYGARIAAALAGGVGWLGAVTDVEPRLERLLARADLGDLAVSSANRVAPSTATGLLVLSAATLALSGEVRRAVLLSQVLSVVAVAFGVLTLYSQIYLDPTSRPEKGLTATALHTTAAIIVLGVALLVARPDTGLATMLTGAAPSAALGRRLLVAAVVVPFALGWLLLLGQHDRLYATAIGTTLLVAANAAVFATLGFFGALSASRAEATQRRAEGVAREQARIQTLLDNVPAVVFLKDLDGRYQFVNREFERVTGVDRTRVVGSTDEGLYPAGVVEQIRALDQRALASATAVQDVEVIPDREGQRSYLTVRFPLLDAEARRTLCGVATDITERMQGAAEREQLQRRLYQSERLDILSRLAGGIAHDFNNLLASIMGRAELIRDAPAGEDLGHDAQAIIRAAERGATLTQQLLIFSRTQPGRPETVHLNPLVAEAAQSVRQHLPTTIHLVTRLAPDLPATRIDPARIGQLLGNLTDNARAAMPGGGRLTIETASIHIGPDHEADPYAPAGDFLRLTVTDTGCGMPPEVAERAFEPFFTTRGTGEGTGLGLATVYGIAKQAGGDVTLWTRAEGGTIVRVYLPAIAAPAGLHERPSAPATGGHNATVLVVDDEDEIRELVRRILSRHGYQPLTAGSATEAVRLWQGADTHIDALLTDLVMPGQSGHQLAERLRQDRPDLPVVFMSGYTADTLPTGQTWAPPIALLHKPFDTAALLNRLQEALGHAAALAATTTQPATTEPATPDHATGQHAAGR